MKILFMGTPTIAAAMLQQCLDDGCEVVGVVTQPDKKTGRKQIVQPCSVKKKAIEYNLPLFQFQKITKEYQPLLKLNYDLIITCAYGQLVPLSVLEHANVDAINVHASLLPKYRGGAPIQRCIMNNEQYSGVSIMRMVKKMDAGAICYQKTIKLSNNETSKSLFEKCEVLGKEMLNHVLPLIMEHKISFVEQDPLQVSFAPIIRKEDEKIDFNNRVHLVDAQIRALYDTPNAYALMENTKVKIISATSKQIDHSYQIGEVLTLSDEGLPIACINGLVYVKQVQLEGKQATQIKDFYNGVGRRWIGKRFS